MGIVVVIVIVGAIIFGAIADYTVAVLVPLISAVDMVVLCCVFCFSVLNRRHYRWLKPRTSIFHHKKDRCPQRRQSTGNTL